MLATILALVMALGVTTISWADDAKGTAGNPYTLDEFNALTEGIAVQCMFRWMENPWITV